MENSLFRSNTYGIGQLISQKKRLEVPLYQRNFSWGATEVDQFIEDIISAVEENYRNYFLGSILLTQPKEGVWGILDGQQRLTTVSIIYSTIRYLLFQKNQSTDAEQIASEFLGIRILGGEYHSRIQLNGENRIVYTQSVVELCSDEKLASLKNDFSGSGSNLLILGAITRCRRKISDWISSKQHEDVFYLYKLSSFLETKVLVVAIEVADESDAYIAFETLNTRGQDLSALDLVKNYIFSSTNSSDHDTVRLYWSIMKENIGEREADDFLRIFWMGNYGLIQKSRLYQNLKIKFHTPDLTLQLAEKLSAESLVYAALEDAKHEFWQKFSPFVRHLVDALNILKSKQTRPVIFACANAVNITNDVMENVLWYMLVLTMRFQTVGKKRQGILEKLCARIAEEISTKEVVDVSYVKLEVEKTISNDQDFASDFRRYQEISSKRALYVLIAIECFVAKNVKHYSEIWEEIDIVLDSISSVSVTHILPKAWKESWMESNNDDDDIDAVGMSSNIANWVLINSFDKSLLQRSRLFERSLFMESHFITTQKVGEIEHWNYSAFLERQNWLGSIATKVWTLK